MWQRGSMAGMGTSTGQVTGHAASVYETFFVPALFGEWAPRVADALGPLQDGPVLDVACGTGVLSRELARRLPVESVAGLDCNEGMLAVASQLQPEIDWHCARAEALPFESGRFAAVASQFGLMFFEDRPRALREMWRVLAPGGRLAVAVWGPLQETPGYASMTELLRSLFGETIAAELRAPFSLGDASALGEMFEATGITTAKLQTVLGRARFPSIEAWVHTDVWAWTLADRIDDAQYARLKREAERQLTRYTLADGRVDFAISAHIVSARKP
jgi:SAM-dependent methyltransferase